MVNHFKYKARKSKSLEARKRERDRETEEQTSILVSDQSSNNGIGTKTPSGVENLPTAAI